MALSDRKIPILTGINDTPSTTGQPKHPNASLLCKQYNDLIDNELTALQQSIGGQDYSVTPINPYPDDIYINFTTGNDTTGDGSETLPFATLQKAISVLGTTRILYRAIRCEGTFTLSVLDLRNIVSVSSRSYGINGNLNSFYQVGLNIIGGTFTINNSFDENDYLTMSTPYSNILTGDKVYFDGCTFNITGNDALLLKNCNCYFNNCTFDFTGNTAPYLEHCIIAHDSTLVLIGCTFIWDATLSDSLFLGFSADITLTDCTFTKTNGTLLAIVGSHNKLLLANTAVIDLSFLKYSLVFINPTTNLIEDFTIDTSNLVHNTTV